MVDVRAAPPAGPVFAAFSWRRPDYKMMQRGWLGLLRTFPLAAVNLTDKITASLYALPTAIVFGSFAWNGGEYKGEKTTAGFLKSYEDELREFLALVIAEPSYSTWWAHKRLFFRMSLPVFDCIGKQMPECLHGQDAADACNNIASRVIAEMAPDIVQLDLSRLLLTRGDNRTTADLAVDAFHYKHHAQVLLMRGALTAVLRAILERDADMSDRLVPVCSLSANANMAGGDGRASAVSLSRSDWFDMHSIALVTVCICATSLLALMLARCPAALGDGCSGGR
jgi:hypothetical protein